METGLTVEQIPAISTALAGFDCAVIYLFGSRAKGSSRPDSDIDIAFLPSRPASPLECFRIAGELSGVLGAPVDLVNLSTASTVMAKEVVAYGIALFIGDLPAHRTFEMYTFSDYARLNEERKEILAS